ncbi:hypothetical protein MOSE0_L02762 [Monosporozyma servazzii]
MMTAKPPRQKKTPACRQCRQRKIGCDRIRPSCGNCIKRNVPNCEYPEKKSGLQSDKHHNFGVTITAPTAMANPPMKAFQPIPSQQPLQVAHNKLENGAVNGAMKFKNFVDMPININKVPTSSGNNNNTNHNNNTNNNTNLNFPIKHFNHQMRNGSPAANVTMGTQNIINKDPYVPKYVKPNNMVKEREDDVEVNEVMFNTRMNSVEINESNGNGQSLVNTRVQLLNEKLNSIPQLFNPTDVSAIYTKQNRNSTHSKSKKNNNNNNKKQDDADNTVLNQPSPVFYDLMTSAYSQEEILLKEMQFLKDRYLELLQYQSKYSHTKEEDTDSNKKREGEHITKKRKIVDSASDAVTIPKENPLPEKPKEIKVPFPLLKSIDELIRANETNMSKLPPTLNNYLNLTPLTLTFNNLISEDPNTIFKPKFIILRDSFLPEFYQHLIKLFKQNYEPILQNYFIYKSKRNNFLQYGNLDNPVSSKFDQDFINLFLKICSDQMRKLNEFFFPILDFKLIEWNVRIEMIFKDTNNVFDKILLGDIESIKLIDLSFCGVVIIMMLFVFYNIRHRSWRSKYDFNVDEAKVYKSIEEYKTSLIRSLLIIKGKLINKTNNVEDEEITKNILKFLTLYEILQETYPIDLVPCDCHEDIILALERSVNHVNNIKDKELKLYWNFISNNYCNKNLFQGKVPLLLVGKISTDYCDDMALTANKNNFVGGSINQNGKERNEIDRYNFTVSQLKIVYYLNNGDTTKGSKTINEMETLVKDMDDKYFKYMKQSPLPEHILLSSSSSNDSCFNGIDTLNGSLQYYKMKLYLEYLIFLQWENYKDEDNIVIQFNKLFERVVIPMIMLIFPSSQEEEEEEEGGDIQYDFLFFNKRLNLLEGLLDILFAIYARFENFSSCHHYKMQGEEDRGETDVGNALKAITLNLRHLFIIMLIILDGWSHHSARQQEADNQLRPRHKVEVMLVKMMHDDNIRSKLLFSVQTLTKDPITGMLSQPENIVFEDKYTRITRQEYISQTQQYNNGLRYVTNLDTLGRYGKMIKILNHRLMQRIGRNDINTLADLDGYLAHHVIPEANSSTELGRYNITPQNVPAVFDTFFH